MKGLYYHLTILSIVALLFGSSSSAPASASAQTVNSTAEEIANDQIYELLDANFNQMITRKEYKWLILFYLKTCAHCARAKKEIEKLYQTVLDSSMRFGQIEIQSNIMTSIRFNTTQVPYIVLFQDGKMFEFTKYPNKKNLNEFINSDRLEEDALNVPKPPSFLYVAWVMLRDGVKSLQMSLEQYLHKKGYKVKLKTTYLVSAAFIFLALLCLFEYWCLSRCCSIDDFEKYIQQQEIEMKAKKSEANPEGNNDDNDTKDKSRDDQQQPKQQQPEGQAIDEESRRKEAELKKEKEKQPKKKKVKKDKEKTA